MARRTENELHHAIPLHFTTDKPEALRSELERFARSMDAHTRAASEAFEPRLIAVPTLNPSMLVFGQTVRLSLRDGDSLDLHLPPPDSKHSGKKCTLLRRTATGLIRVHGGAALVAGESVYRMANEPHFVEFLLDDGAWYPSRAGAGAIP
jgi:hypothetical protein